MQNPLGRYAIGDRDKLKTAPDGSVTIYVQHDSPGKALEPNWLPAPPDSFNVFMRLYWPGQNRQTLETGPLYAAPQLPPGTQHLALPDSALHEPSHALVVRDVLLRRRHRDHLADGGELEIIERLETPSLWKDRRFGGGAVVNCTATQPNERSSAWSVGRSHGNRRS